MYSPGDRVKVRGFRGKEAELYVWGVKEQGLMLCTEEGYQLLIGGSESPIVGFPMCDIMGLVEEPQTG